MDQISDILKIRDSCFVVCCCVVAILLCCWACYFMYHPSFVCISLNNSIFGEFSNIYLLSAQSRVYWRHKFGSIAKKNRSILNFLYEKTPYWCSERLCQVSCRYSKRWRSYSGKTLGVWSEPKSILEIVAKCYYENRHLHLCFTLATIIYILLTTSHNFWTDSCWNNF